MVYELNVNVALSDSLLRLEERTRVVLAWVLCARMMVPELKVIWKTTKTKRQVAIARRVNGERSNEM